MYRGIAGGSWFLLLAANSCWAVAGVGTHNLVLFLDEFLSSKDSNNSPLKAWRVEAMKATKAISNTNAPSDTFFLLTLGILYSSQSIVNLIP